MEKKFHRKIYRKKAISAAAQAYGELATVKIENKGDYFLVKLTDVDKDVRDFVMDDFANHVLFETITGRQQW